MVTKAIPALFTMLGKQSTWQVMIRTCIWSCMCHNCTVALHRASAGCCHALPYNVREQTLFLITVGIGNIHNLSRDVLNEGVLYREHNNRSIDLKGCIRFY